VNDGPWRSRGIVQVLAQSASGTPARCVANHLPIRLGDLTRPDAHSFVSGFETHDSLRCAASLRVPWIKDPSKRHCRAWHGRASASARVLIVKALQPLHLRSVHPAKFRFPLVEGRGAIAMLTSSPGPSIGPDPSRIRRVLRGDSNVSRYPRRAHLMQMKSGSRIMQKTVPIEPKETLHATDLTRSGNAIGLERSAALSSSNSEG
jgi:hypothetical protein